MYRFKNGRFDYLMEQAISRHQLAGFLVGDYVRIKKNALKNEIIQDFSSQTQDKIKQIIKDDMYMRISAIKSGSSEAFSGPVGATNVMKKTMWADCYMEYAPGMWNNVMTLPLSVLEKIDVDDGTGYAPYNKNIVRKNPEINTGENLKNRLPTRHASFAEKFQLKEKKTYITSLKEIISEVASWNIGNVDNTSKKPPQVSDGIDVLRYARDIFKRVRGRDRDEAIKNRAGKDVNNHWYIADTIKSSIEAAIDEYPQYMPPLSESEMLSIQRRLIHWLFYREGKRVYMVDRKDLKEAWAAFYKEWGNIAQEMGGGDIAVRGAKMTLGLKEEVKNPIERYRKATAADVVKTFEGGADSERISKDSYGVRSNIGRRVEVYMNNIRKRLNDMKGYPEIDFIDDVEHTLVNAIRATKNMEWWVMEKCIRKIRSQRRVAGSDTYRQILNMLDAMEEMIDNYEQQDSKVASDNSDFMSKWYNPINSDIKYFSIGDVISYSGPVARHGMRKYLTSNALYRICDVYKITSNTAKKGARSTVTVRKDSELNPIPDESGDEQIVYAYEIVMIKDDTFIDQFDVPRGKYITIRVTNPYYLKLEYVEKDEYKGTAKRIPKEEKIVMEKVQQSLLSISRDTVPLKGKLITEKKRRGYLSPTPHNVMMYAKILYDAD